MVRNITASSEQVAASSEELTAGGIVISGDAQANGGGMIVVGNNLADIIGDGISIKGPLDGGLVNLNIVTRCTGWGTKPSPGWLRWACTATPIWLPRAQ